jgi:hypothetical protein
VNEPVTNWMRRRIERSRARCEKAATNNRPVKEQGADKQPASAALAPLEPEAKNN